ncbi:MFS transporter [Phyllobacterium sp. SB3]|uniref:MFS transporter n=1 Tax=Phyllobacterium sp. SB3 TaxID=3156073 RepID=UPI0032AF22F0
MEKRAAARQNWVHVFIIVAAGIIAAMQVIKPSIAAPLLKSSLGIDLPSVGWLISIFALLGMFGGIPAGAFVTAWGDRRMLLWGLFAIALAAASGAVSTSFELLLATRVLEGIGFTLVIVAGPALITRLAPEKTRPMAFGLWSCFMPAGIALSMLCGPLFSSWQAVWWASSIVAAIAFAISMIVLPSSRRGSPFSWKELRSNTRATFGSSGPIILAITFALYSLQFFTIFSFLPVLLTERMNVSLQAAGTLSAIATAMNILGNLAAGMLIGKGAQRWVLVAAATLVMGLCSFGILLPILPNPIVLLLCMLFSAAGGLIPATLIATAPVLSSKPRLTPFTIGLIMQGSNLGQVIGPIVVGSFIQAFGWSSVVTISAFAAVLCMSTSLLLRQALRIR